MEVKKGNKVLYHIQNMNMGSDGHPFDTYVWCDHEPSKDDLEKVFDMEWRDGYADDKSEALEEWLTSSEIYKLYVEEL